MANVDKSIKLVSNEFHKSIAEVPLEVYYQTLTADQYNANGFQFNIKQPGALALLDTDIWIKYRIKVLETTAGALSDSFENQTLNVHAGAVADRDILRVPFPAQATKFGFRSGNVMQRAIQNLQIMINNRTITVQPYRWIDVMNRLYISNDQSEHEFGASGGRFDEGNHGNRTDSVTWAVRNRALGATFNADNDNVSYQSPYYVSSYTAVNRGAAAAVDAATSKQLTYLYNGYAVPSWPTQAEAIRDDPLLNMYPNYFLKYQNYNPGFSHRVDKFTNLCRRNRAEQHSAADSFNVNWTGGGVPGTVVTLANIAAIESCQFTANQAPATGAVAKTWYFDLYERLPTPLFKMYSNDEVFGVYPNIVQMQIQANFVTLLRENIFRCTNNALGFTVDWTAVTGSSCELYLRWYTPPQTMTIPREITIPYKKINVWAKSYSKTAANAAQNVAYRDVSVSEFGITLEAIPDLLLIYMKFNAGNYTTDTPDDYNGEWIDFSINIDNASGKLNQINSLDLYNKWKKLLKHSDNKIVQYDEWRKYLCVACLQPEDYGVRYGPGYSNSTNLAVKGTCRFWDNNPSISWTASEPLGGAGGAGTQLELEIVSIYNRNSLTIRADGSASEELLRMAADFNMGVPSMGAVPPPDIRGVLMP